MLVNNHRENMEERLRDEHLYLSQKYPNVAFNVRTWGGASNEDKDYLYATEGYITIPDNYKAETLAKFKALLTPNRKFAEMNNNLNIIVTNGPLDSHNYFALDEFLPYEERINGIVAMYNIYSTGKPGDILWMREQVMNNIPFSENFTKHVFGRKPWGGDMFQGQNGFHGNHISNLETQHKYRYVLCLEPMHHEIWSWDWVTERLWNAFKTKTVPIYFGCYNIEDLVPESLYVDYRKFPDLTELAKYVENMPRSQWEDMTEAAYDWYYNECKISNLDDLEEILSSCK